MVTQSTARVDDLIADWEDLGTAEQGRFLDGLTNMMGGRAMTEMLHTWLKGSTHASRTEFTRNTSVECMDFMRGIGTINLNEPEEDVESTFVVSDQDRWGTVVPKPSGVEEGYAKVPLINYDADLTREPTTAANNIYKTMKSFVASLGAFDIVRLGQILADQLKSDPHALKGVVSTLLYHLSPKDVVRVLVDCWNTKPELMHVLWSHILEEMADDQDLHKKFIATAKNLSWADRSMIFSVDDEISVGPLKEVAALFVCMLHLRGASGARIDVAKNRTTIEMPSKINPEGAVINYDQV